MKLSLCRKIVAGGRLITGVPPVRPPAPWPRRAPALGPVCSLLTPLGSPGFGFGLALNISSIRSVTRKPPTTLIVPKAIAITSSALLSPSSPGRPTSSRPPSRTIPWIAFVPDINGVCSVFGTFEITTKPMKPASTRIARLVVSVLARITSTPVGLRTRRPACRRRRAATDAPRGVPPDVPPQPRPRFGPRMDDLPVAHDARAADDLIVEVQRAALPSSPTNSSSRACTLRANSCEECSGIPAGRFSGETIFTSWRTTVSPGSVSSQLPPASPAMSTITEPAFIPSTASAVTSRGRGAPGDERGRDDHVEALDRLGQRLLLGGALLVGQLARVAALAAGLQAEVEPLRAQRLDLLCHLGAHVIAGRARAQALGGRERLQPGDADAQHEHLRRRDRAGGGHQHRVEAAHLLGAEQRGAVAGDVALRGQRVHRLRARDPRDRLHRERGRPGIGQRARGLRAGQRREEADQDRAGAEAGGSPRRRAARSSRPRRRPTPRKIERPPAPDAQRVPRSARRPARRRRPAAGRRRPRRSGRGRRDLGPQLADDLRHERNPVLSRRGLLRNTDPHMRAGTYPIAPTRAPPHRRRCAKLASQRHDRQPDPHLHKARRRRRDPPRRHEPRLQARPARGGLRHRRRAERDARRRAAAARAPAELRRVAAPRAERPARPRRRPVGARSPEGDALRQAERERLRIGARLHRVARARLRRGQRQARSRCARS